MDEFDDDDSRDKYDLFISYAHADDQNTADRTVRKLVDAIKLNYERVTGNPLRVFFDVNSIRSMDDWELRILTGLRQSKMMLAILSPTYFSRPYCRKEWEYYIETELAHALPGEGITPIYIIKYPGFPAGPLKKRMKDWVKDLRKRQYIDWLDFWPHGAAALELADAQEKINRLTSDIVHRLGRASTLAVNHHVPRPSRYFVGRRTELRDLRKLMLKGHIGAISAVHGIAGIGKSTLAFAYAWSYGFKYPGGRFLIKAEGQDSLDGGMIGLASAKGVALSDEELKRPSLALAKVRQAFLDGPPALIVIDNLDDPDLLGPRSVEQSLPRANHVHILATTRVSPGQLDWLACLPLDSLTSVDGQKLLNRFRPIQDAPLDDEWKAALEIVNRLAGHALALEVVGVYLGENKDVTYRQFAATLAAEGISLLEEEVGPQVKPARKWHPESCVARLLEPTLAALSAEEWRLVQLAAHLPPDAIPVAWLRALILAEFPELGKARLADRIEPLFRRLDRLRLLVPGAEKTKTSDEAADTRLAKMHRLVQDVILRRSGPEAEGETREVVTAHVIERALWIEANWGKLGLEWELYPLRDMTLRMIERGDHRGAILPYRIDTPLEHIGRSFDARTLWRKSRELWETLLVADSGNLDHEREISVCDNRLGDLAVAAGDADAARRYYEDGLAIARRLADASPGNAEYASDLSVSYNKLGDLAVNDGKADVARRYYQDGQAIRKRLADESPGNVQYARDLSISYEKLGNLAVNDGKADDARRYYQDGLAIRKRLADESPGNVQYARDLSISYEKLGNLAVNDGKADDARRYYQDGLAIRKRLADESPGNVQYARDLSVSYEKLGNLAVNDGKADDARRYYQDGLAIARRLADESPGNVQYARDLSISYEKLGNLAVNDGKADDARRYYQDGLAIRKRLADESPGNVQYARDLSVSYDNLGDLAVYDGKADLARRYYEDGLAIRKRLADESPGNAEFARDLSVSFIKIAGLLQKNGDQDATLWYQRAWKTLDSMKRRGMHLSPGDQQVLKYLEDRFGFGS